MTEPHELTHDVADDVLNAIRGDKLNLRALASVVVAHEIGPLLELAYGLSDDPVVSLGQPVLPTSPTLKGFVEALAADRAMWIPGTAPKLGFYRTRQPPGIRDEVARTLFGRRAQTAAEASGFPSRAARALIGAMGEIEDNIFEHSDVPMSGIIAFQGGIRAFTFVVADGGLGVRDSLRQSPEFADLNDHGDALKLALTDGVSRFAYVDPDRGTGFRGLFVGLASLHGRIRFTSGDHTLLVEGRSPSLSAHRLIQKPTTQGTVMSVTCRPYYSEAPDKAASKSAST